YGNALSLVTWYKPVVNRLVPCDLCDHSQISHVVSNDVTSDILLTTLHVITVGTGSRCCALPGSAHKQGAGRPFIDGHPTLQCH
ncbi:unnamed protein product, partial [Staurois parvus]